MTSSISAIFDAWCFDALGVDPSTYPSRGPVAPQPSPGAPRIQAAPDTLSPPASDIAAPARSPMQPSQTQERSSASTRGDKGQQVSGPVDPDTAYADPGAATSSSAGTAERLLTRVTIDPPNASLMVGEAPQSFGATGDYSDGTSELLTTVAEWRSSDPKLISIDSNGRATALEGPGEVGLTATYAKSAGSAETVIGTATAAVVTLVEIFVSPNKPSVAGGTTLPFTAQGKYTDTVSADGPRRDLTKQVEWSSSDTDVVAIDGNGHAVAKSVNGHAVITATTRDGRFSSATGVDVSIPILQALTIGPPGPIVGHQQFTATGHYAYGRDQDQTQDETEAVEWTASPADVLAVENKVGKKGLASARKSGRARLTVTEQNSGKTAYLDVDVAMPAAPVLVGITIAPSPALLVGTVRLKATGTYSGVAEKDPSGQVLHFTSRESDLSRQVKWSTSAADVVAIDQDGNATAQPKSGAATLSAQLDNVRGSIIVTVKAPVLTSISVYSDGTPSIGKQQNFHATGELSDGTSLVMTTMVNWSSSDPSVISIDQKTGVATVKTAGSATITAEDKSHPVVGWQNVVVKTASPPGKLTSAAVQMLIDNLKYLGQKTFQRAIGKPGPSRLRTAGEPSVDLLLSQAADVVRLWADPKTLPASLQIWTGIERPMLALLTEAQDPKGLGFTPQAVKPAQDAVAAIADYLSVQEVDLRMDEETNDTPTPELSKDLDARALKQLEPALKAWRQATQMGGPLAGLPEMRKLSEALDIYFSTADPEKQLQAFRQAHLLEEQETLADLYSFFFHNGVSAASAVTEGGIELAKAAVRAGHHEADAAAEALEQRLAVIHGVGGAFAFFDMVMGTVKLMSGIAEGNWHDIAEGGATLAMGGVGMGEAAGVVAADTTAMATAGIVVTWAVFDVALSAGEQAIWAKKERELKAFKNLVKEARSLVPIGKRMAAAVKLMHGTEADTEPVPSDNNIRYREIAEDSAAKIGKGLRNLLAHHIMRTDPDSVGGYPELVEPVVPMLKAAYEKIDYKVPETLVDAFDVTVTAVQAMLAEEAATNNPDTE